MTWMSELSVSVAIVSVFSTIFRQLWANFCRKSISWKKYMIESHVKWFHETGKSFCLPFDVALKYQQQEYALFIVLFVLILCHVKEANLPHKKQESAFLM